MSNLPGDHWSSSRKILPQSYPGPGQPSRDPGKEQISCRSCRLKKMRCSRTRPSCQACELCRCDCLYDAVPRKKGPNTEVLKQMLKRIDGLEKKLAEKDNPGAAEPQASTDEERQDEVLPEVIQPVGDKFEIWEAPQHYTVFNDQAIGHYSHSPPQIINAFFENFNGNPYSFLHPSMTRKMAAQHKLPPQLMNAIYANSVRYLETDETLRRSKCEELVGLARQQLDVDEPSLENTQTSLLLSLANFSIGRGKGCWMQLGVAIRMSQALDLQRELSPTSEATDLGREIARRTFWTCYIMDRLNVAGSRRPCSIDDKTISLRMPCEESSFHNGSPIAAPYFQQSKLSHDEPFQSPGSMFVDIVRILGRAVQYLQRGGVKGDSHFPWHPQSRLSSIHDELRTWASRISRVGPQAASIDDSATASTVFLSQCIYHHVYVLVYRPFLPFRLTDADAETEPLQKSWQKEAIEMCLQHAVYIADLETSRENHGGLKTPPYLS